MKDADFMSFSNEVEYIPIDPSKIPCSFSVRLEDRTYTMTIKYNDVGEFFTIDLAVMATGEVLCYGEPVRYGRPMFRAIEDERYPIPVIIPFCVTGEEEEVTHDNFGRTVQLYLYERRSE